jgi:hypothetical protein
VPVEGVDGVLHACSVFGGLPAAVGFFVGDVLHVRHDPPDVPEQVLDAGAAVTPSAVVEDRNCGGTRGEGGVEGGIGIVGVKAKVRRRGGPVRSNVEGQDY